MLRHAIFALLLATSVLTQPQIPNTPVGKVFTAWLTSFNSGDVEQVREFDRQYPERGRAALPSA